MYSLHLGTCSFTRVRCVLKKDNTGGTPGAFFNFLGTRNLVRAAGYRLATHKIFPTAEATGAAASQCVTPRGVRQYGGL